MELSCYGAGPDWGRSRHGEEEVRDRREFGFQTSWFDIAISHLRKKSTNAAAGYESGT